MRAWWIVVACAAPVWAETSQPAKTSAQRSKWQGTYVCAQGVTGVNLTIDERCRGDTCTLAAIFEFGEVKENPGVPHGSYKMIGESHGLVYTLKPDAWIERPDGYIMVGLTATKDPEQHTMTGRIDNESCGDIALKNVP